MNERFQPRNEQGHQPTRRANLQIRLALGREALDPEISIENRIDSVQPITDFQPINVASTNERYVYWQQRKEIAPDQQMSTWRSEIAQTMKTQTAKSHEDFLSEYFQKTKLNDSLDTVDEATADRIYTRYFHGNNTESDSQQFIHDVLITHGIDMSNPETITTDSILKLQQNLPSIQWMANIFGSQSAEIIAEITYLQAILIHPDAKQQFLSFARASINQPLSPHDDYLLRSFATYSQQSVDQLIQSGTLIDQQGVFVYAAEDDDNEITTNLEQDTISAGVVDARFEHADDRGEMADIAASLAAGIERGEIDPNLTDEVRDMQTQVGFGGNEDRFDIDTDQEVDSALDAIDSYAEQQDEGFLNQATNDAQFEAGSENTKESETGDNSGFDSNGDGDGEESEGGEGGDGGDS